MKSVIPLRKYKLLVGADFKIKACIAWPVSHNITMTSKVGRVEKYEIGDYVYLYKENNALKMAFMPKVIFENLFIDDGVVNANDFTIGNGSTAAATSNAASVNRSDSPASNIPFISGSESLQDGRRTSQNPVRASAPAREPAGNEEQSAAEHAAIKKYDETSKKYDGTSKKVTRRSKIFSYKRD